MNEFSDMFEIRFEGFDGDFYRRVRIRSPKFLSVEAHRIKPLRILALAGDDGVRKDMSAVQALDHPHVAARIARQARMCPWMNVLRAHVVADFEPRRRRCRPPIRAAPHDTLHIGQRELAAAGLLAGTQSVASSDFV